MPDLSIEVNTKNIELLFNIFPRELKRGLADALDHISRKFLKKFQIERLSGPPGIQMQYHGIFHRFKRVVTMESGKKRFLNPNESQKITSSAIAKSASDPLDMSVEIYTRSKIAEKFEIGGPINAKDKLMHIPLSERAKQHASIPGLTEMKVGKNIFLVQNLGHQKLLFHYLLRKQVPVRRHLGFYDTWNSMDSERMQILNESVGKVISRI